MNNQKVAQSWNHYAELRQQGLTGDWWEAGPVLQAEINRRISDDTDTDWIDYSIQRHFTGKTPVSACLSLGCGTGWLERRLFEANFFQRCDAFDVADGCIRIAQEIASHQGIGDIDYQVRDINSLTLPENAYDAVWVNNAMHHFLELEQVCTQVSKALKPGGYFILNEYVGPNRFNFGKRQREVMNLCLNLIPEHYRQVRQETIQREIARTPARMGWKWFLSRVIDKMRDGSLLYSIQRRIKAQDQYRNRARRAMSQVFVPSVRDLVAGDPSEAVRSEEILPVMRQYFEIVEQKDYGGTILQFLLAGIAGNFNDGTDDAAELLRMLLHIEETLIRLNELQSDFSYIVARPKNKLMS